MGLLEDIGSWQERYKETSTKYDLEQAEKQRKDIQDAGNALITHGTGLYETWVKLAYQKPPEDFFGRLLWTAGVIGQLVLSIFTFPAALGAFLLEESVQSAGMGAYMLSQSKYYDLLDTYLDSYGTMIDTSEIAAKSLAGFSPVTGGAVLIYMEAAKMSWGAFRVITDRKLLEQAATDEKARKKILDDQKYGSVHLASLPTGAKITLDGVDQEVETPELFKKLEAGSHKFTLVKEKAATGEKWEYELTTNVTAGKKKEITIHLKQTAGETKTPGSVDETPETPKIPDFIKAEVTGDYAIDGDTFVTTSGERVRVLGIDAPELGRPYADLAKTFLESKTADKKVVLSIQTHLPIDVYGRTLALCTYRDENLSVALVAAGLAKSDIFPDARYDPTRILEAEKIAKARRIGIWSDIP